MRPVDTGGHKSDDDPGTQLGDHPMTSCEEGLALLEGRTMYLRVAGERQEPGRLTGPGGCVTWSEPEPGVSYGVEEGTVPGWTALTPPSHTFGVGSALESYAHTFVNVEEEGHRVYLPLAVR